MGDYYSSPEPGWQRDFDNLRRDLKDLKESLDRATQLVKWGFAISWVAIAAMYIAGFAYYLPASIKATAPDIIKTEIQAALAPIKSGQEGSDKKLDQIIQFLTPSKKTVDLEGTAWGPAQPKPRVTTKDSNDVSGITHGTCPHFPVSNLQFGAVAVREAGDRTITWANKGGPVTLGQPQIIGHDPRDFSVTGNSCPTSFETDETCDVTVEFSPRQVGPRHAELVMSCDSANQITTNLSGVGR
jgi:hypothetical protein